MCLPLETSSLSQHCFWSKFHQTIIQMLLQVIRTRQIKKTKPENLTLTLRSRPRIPITHCSWRSLKDIHVLSVTVEKVNLSSFSECSDISSWIKFSTKWGFGMVQFSFMACRNKGVNVEIPVCQDTNHLRWAEIFAAWASLKIIILLDLLLTNALR